MAMVHRRAGRPEEAEKHCRRAVDEMEMLCEQNSEVATYTIWLAAYQTALADMLERRGESARARELLTETLTELDAIAERDAMRPFADDVRRRSRRVLAKCSVPGHAQDGTRGE
jgi:hypothetical protein